MKKLLYFFLPLLAFVACTEGGVDDSNSGNSNNNQNQEETDPIIVETNPFVTDYMRGYRYVDIRCAYSWQARIVEDVDWVILKTTSGSAGNHKLTLNIERNNATGSDRSVTIKIIDQYNNSETIIFTQKCKDALTVTSSKFEVGFTGGEVEVEVNANANIDYDYTIEESAKSWVKYKTTRAMETSTLVFDVAENEDNEKREAKITIHSGDISEVVTIYQDGAKPSIILTQNEYTVSDEGETIAVEVKSGVDVGVEILDNEQWVSRVSSRAMSAMTYYFKVEQNDTHENREARIKFFNRENNLEEIVTINQMQKDAIVLAQSSYTIGSEGGKIDIEVGHNVDFDIQITGDWISNASTRAFENETLSFNIAANTAETSREGMIKFVVENGRITQTVTIVQEQKIVKPAEFRVKVTCEEYVLHNIVAEDFGANVTSIKKDGEWYVITLQNGCSTIPSFTFYNFDYLTNVLINDGVTSIGDGAFSECSSLANVTIGDSVTEIGERAFSSCSSLTSITIPDSVTEIGAYAFSSCSSLAAFYGKFSSKDNRCLIVNGVLNSFAPAEVTEYVIPDSVTEIGDGAFSSCYSLTSVTIGDSVTEIGAYAFSSCSSLTSITIPDSVTEIGKNAFYYCSSLASVIIGNGVTEIGESGFEDCNSLKSVTIGNSVTLIGGRAFHYCSLTSVIIPDSVTEIGIMAFKYNPLTSITIGNSVTLIKDMAFANCLLTNLTIPDSVIEIRTEAFNNNPLERITIGSSVSRIDKMGFYNEDGDFLTEVYCKPINPPSLGSLVFPQHHGAPIYVPAGSLDSYKNHYDWRYNPHLKGYYF